MQILFSENVVFTKLISIVMAFAELLIGRLFFIKAFNLDFSKKKTTLYLFISFPLEIINICFAPISFFPFINIAIVFVVLYFLFRKEFVHSTFFLILPFTIFQVLKLFFTYTIAFMFDIQPSSLKKVPIVRPFIIIPSYLIMFSLMKIFDKMKFSKNFYNGLDTPSKLIIHIFSFACLFTVLLNGHFLYSAFSTVSFAFVLLNMLLISIVIILLIKILKLQYVENNLDSEKKSYITLSHSYDGIREFKHDFSNIMQSIGGYLSADDFDGLKHYYSSIFKDCDELKKLSVFNKDVLNSPPVLSLLTEKYYKSKNLGIDFNIEVFIDLTTLNMDIYEFNRILGIFLDNSIEAAENSSEKFINIIIARDGRAHYDYLTIENSCNSDSKIDKDKIFEKNYSTKPNNTGLGLWKVKKILKKYDNISLYTSVENGVFSHQLRIYY